MKSNDNNNNNNNTNNKYYDKGVHLDEMTQNHEQSTTSTATWLRSFEEAELQLDEQRRVLQSLPITMLRVNRVNQLDAEQIDAEVVDMISAPWWQALKSLGIDWIDKYRAELDLALSALFWTLSVGSSGTTFGASLQNLDFRIVDSTGDHRRQVRLSGLRRLLHGVGSVVVPYIWHRASHYVESNRWKMNTQVWWKYVLANAMRKLDRFFRILRFCNTILFLSNGQYPTLIARLLRIRLVELRAGAARTASYALMNRDLVWQTLTDFLLFVMPLINVAKWKARLARFLRTAQHASKESSSVSKQSVELSQSVDSEAELSFAERMDARLSRLQCVECSARPANTPYCAAVSASAETSTEATASVCAHTYCYLCIMRCLRRDGGCTYCVLCNLPIERVRRVAVVDVPQNTNEHNI